MGLIICYQCGAVLGTHTAQGDTHGLCGSCHQEAMEEARQARDEHLKRKGGK
jgi:hypothetical protein